MELRHLRYFAAVAAHGSFSRAARSLHLTQPALSRQVKDLEEELGVALLVRGTNAVTLSAAGELFYDEANDLLRRADRAVQRVQGNARTEHLRVGYGPSLTSDIMPRALERFQATVPRVHLELADVTPREMADLANAGELDMVITPTGLEPAIPSFQWADLRPAPVVLVIPRTHPLARLKRVPPARLRDLPLIGLSRESFPEYIRVISTMLKSRGLVPRFVCHVKDGVGPLLTAVEARGAATLLTAGVAALLPRTFVARPFFPRLPAVAIKVGLPAVRPSGHAETFARILRELARGKRR